MIFIGGVVAAIRPVPRPLKAKDRPFRHPISPFEYGCVSHLLNLIRDRITLAGGSPVNCATGDQKRTETNHGVRKASICGWRPMGSLNHPALQSGSGSMVGAFPGTAASGHDQPIGACGIEPEDDPDLSPGIGHYAQKSDRQLRAVYELLNLSARPPAA
jgi:hypothetical protein